MKEPIVMVLPTSTSMITEDMPMEERGKRGPLSQTALDKADEVLQAHPEAKAIITLLWTPRGPLDTERFFDPIHTCIASDKSLDHENMKEFLDLVIPALIALRVKLQDNPEQFP